MWGLSKSEKRRRGAAMLYKLETGFRENGWPSDFVYDAEHDLYRFPDGEFAFESTPTSDGYARWEFSGSKVGRGPSMLRPY